MCRAWHFYTREDLTWHLGSEAGRYKYSVPQWVTVYEFEQMIFLIFKLWLNPALKIYIGT